MINKLTVDTNTEILWISVRYGLSLFLKKYVNYLGNVDHKLYYTLHIREYMCSMQNKVSFKRVA